ncbi:hypothetical protein [Paenibacillus sp. GCM10027626]|uniref:hypothetical protein n=1 Tax=Paenibacillus sp. GCM10027626 TaxID=3273411 RepID=UPI00363219C3
MAELPFSLFFASVSPQWRIYALLGKQLQTREKRPTASEYYRQVFFPEILLGLIAGSGGQWFETRKRGKPPSGFI